MNFQIDDTIFKIGEKVIIEAKREDQLTYHIIKRGRVIALTTCGAKIWDSTSDYDSPQFAEWFPFLGNNIRMKRT